MPSLEEPAGIWALVAQRAASDPDRVMSTDEHDAELTFGQLHDRAESLAAGLHARGIRADDVVSWQLSGRFETMVLICALSRLGVVQNPLIPMLRGKELEFITRQTRSRLLVVPSVLRGFDHHALATDVASRVPGLEVLDIDAGLPSGDPATLPPAPNLTAEQSATTTRWLFYTSGTTADPKGARHTDMGLLAAGHTYCTHLHLVPDDRVAALAPIAHIGGVLHVVAALQSGCRIITTDAIDLQTTPAQLERAQVTIGGSGVPFLQVFLQQQAQRPDRPLFPRSRCFLVGGSPRPPGLHDRVKDELGGVGTVSGYGMTECPYISWGDLDDPQDRLATTEGRPVPAIDVRITDDDGAPVPAGERGELRVRAPQQMLGYVDATLDAHAFDDDGLLRTGDLATVDADGYLTIVGRIKDVVIRNMENISALEVEKAALGFPGAIETSIIGLPDEQTVERVVAIVVPADPAAPPTLDELASHMRDAGLNPRKLPVQLELVDEIPRTALGKVLKRDLQARFNPATTTQENS
ncbi:MAG: putative O-succinylbenzoate--CoA ligase [Aeromicrobium sp.]|nr:putative O-succinylbenzoate--CoA ligase [Aeromicrobium sp.]